MTIKELSREIERHLNENLNGLIYTFRNASDEDQATGIYELAFDFQHHVRTWAFAIELSLDQEGSSLVVNRGHIIRLKLKPWSDNTHQPIQTIKSWLANDIIRAEDRLNLKSNSPKN